MSEVDKVGLMAWKGLGDKRREYHGELVSLGFAIPRYVPKFGLRSALYHFCFGYASGFPVLDVLWWVLTRCFSKTLYDHLAKKSIERMRKEGTWKGK